MATSDRIDTPSNSSALWTVAILVAIAVLAYAAYAAYGRHNGSSVIRNDANIAGRDAANGTAMAPNNQSNNQPAPTDTTTR